MTFDGNLDLLIPQINPAHGINFTAYVWDDAARCFIEDQGFQDIFNPAIDAGTGQIFSYGAHEQYNSYSIFAYQNGQFVLTDSFGWYPARLDVDHDPDAENSLKFSETHGDYVVNEFTLPDGVNPYIDYSDYPQLAPYFAPGSFWDLNGQKWKCPFLSELPWPQN